MKIDRLTEGISYNGKTFDVSFFSNNESDVINIAEPHITQSKLDNKIYYFGYEFKPEVPKQVRSKFINWIKGLDPDSKPDEFTLENLVAFPIDELNKKENFSQFSCVLYPRSNRSNLTNLIQRCVINCIPRTKIRSFELVKNIPTAVEFDWETFDREYSGQIGDHQYQQIQDYINNTLLPKVHLLDYFSIAQNVKYKYRNYIMSFLTAPPDLQDTLSTLQNGEKILILDDINTSGATLREIIRIIKMINPQLEIYIFTLIGRSH